jgi:nucleoid DNA-binding protein
MAERVQKAEFIRRLVKKMKTDDATAERWLDGIVDTLYGVFKSGKGISLPGFGGFYVDRRRARTVFRFNPGRNYVPCSAGLQSVRETVITH